MALTWHSRWRIRTGIAIATVLVGVVPAYRAIAPDRYPEPPSIIIINQVPTPPPPTVQGSGGDLPVPTPANGAGQSGAGPGLAGTATTTGVATTAPSLPPVLANCGDRRGVLLVIEPLDAPITRKLSALLSASLGTSPAGFGQAGITEDLFDRALTGATTPALGSAAMLVAMRISVQRAAQEIIEEVPYSTFVGDLDLLVVRAGCGPPVARAFRGISEVTKNEHLEDGLLSLSSKLARKILSHVEAVK